MTPVFFLHISFSWVEISLQAKFHPPGLPRIGRFMVGDNKKNQQIHEINGFLSLQLGLSFELGIRLRLTNVCKIQMIEEVFGDEYRHENLAIWFLKHIFTTFIGSSKFAGS